MNDQHFIVRDLSIRQNAVSAVAHITQEPLCEVIIREYVENRSLEQNSYLHALFRNMAKKYSESYGDQFSPDAWKLFFKRKFLGSESVTMPGGDVVEVERSTARQNKTEFSEFVNSVLEYSALEFGINLDENTN